MPSDIPRDPVSPIHFGKDHWSTFGYLETRCVDYKIKGSRFASINFAHMRCDPALHPALARGDPMFDRSKKYPTRLAGGALLENHDDWDCADDLEAAGLIKLGGTGMYPTVQMTKLGLAVASALRAHKASGGQFADFRWAFGVEVTT